MQEVSEKPALPELRVSGSLDDMPAEALSMYLQTLGVQISPQQIMAERFERQTTKHSKCTYKCTPPMNDLGTM